MARCTDASDINSISKPESSIDSAKLDQCRADLSRPESRVATADRETPKNEMEGKRLSFLQDTLAGVLPDILSSNSDTNAQLLQRIAQEREGGYLGAATREGTKQLVGWLVTSIPNIEERLKHAGIDNLLVDGKKITPPSLTDLRSIGNDLISSGNQLKAIDQGLEWADGGLSKLKELLDLKQKESTSQPVASDKIVSLVGFIDQSGLPKGWLQGFEQDPQAWYRQAAPLVSLAHRSRALAVTMEGMARDLGSENLKLPDGARMTKRPDGTVSLGFDLPKDLDLSKPENKAKVEKLSAWLERFAHLSRERAVSWGDSAVPGGKAILDATGSFVGMVDLSDPGFELKPGETTADFNLLEKRFLVEEKNGKVTMKMQVQPQSVPWWSYQNAYYNNVGKSMEIVREYDPGELVSVRYGDSVKLIKASELVNHKLKQQAFHYGEKAVVAAFDASLTVTGGIGVAAALRGGRLLAASGTTGLNMTRRELALKGTYSGFHATMGATGIFNNAGMQDSESGRMFLNTRSVLMLGDISFGLARQGGQLFSGIRNARIPAALSRAEQNTEALIRGTNASGLKFASPMTGARQYSWAQSTGKYAQFPFLAIQAEKIYSH